MKCAELIQLHLIAIGKVCLNFFYKGFNYMFYIAFGHGAILLNGGGQYVDIHLATCEGDLTEVIQLWGTGIADNLSAQIALYKYIHK